MAKKTSREETSRKKTSGKTTTGNKASRTKPVSKRPVRKRAASRTVSKGKGAKAPQRQAKAGPAFLGHARAVTIVCACANTVPANLGRTLQELGVAGGPFQVCVFNAVTAAGYSIALDAIPNSPDTTLIAVVNVIQMAPRAR